jgi:anthranilate/para-aminobenzoate synthase component I
MSAVESELPPLSPPREEFRSLAGRGNLVPVYAELAADLDTPLSAFMRLRPGPYAFLLESVEGGEKWARYSVLGSDPLMVFSAKGNRITIRHPDGHSEILPSVNPLVSYSGTLDSCTADRAVVCHGGRASIQVGARIVADSDPKTEWIETCSKARARILAIRIAAQESA